MLDPASARQLCGVVSDLNRALQGARADMDIATARERRTRNLLAFRIAAVLMKSVRHPMQLPLLPLEILRELRTPRYRGESDPDSTLRAKGHAIIGGRLTLVALPQWQAISLPACTTASALSVRALRLTAGSPLELHYWKVAGPRPAYPQGSQTLSIDDQKPRVLVEQRGAAATLEIRCTSSAQWLLVFELAELACSSAMPDADSVVPATPSGERSVIWRAHQMMLEGGTVSGIAYARERAQGLAKPATHILLANTRLSDPLAWVQHVNSYLRQFEISPLSLRAGSEPIFQRLTCQSANPPVERGPLVSVIMSAYRAVETLPIAVSSLLHQTWRPIQLIIVDDHSDDGTLDVALALAKADDRIMVLHNPVNSGPYVCRNLALRYVRGDYVTCHDADDWAHPERIEAHMRCVLESSGSLRGSMTRMLRVTAEGEFRHIAQIGRATDDGVLRDASTSCLFARETLLNQLGYWDSVRFGADTEMIARAQQLMGSGFARLRLFSMFCLDSDGSLTNDPSSGISVSSGVSPIRRAYRDAWKRWHRSLGKSDTARIDFPAAKRPFPAPPPMVVPIDSIRYSIDRHVLLT